MGFDENDKQQPPDLVSLELDPVEDTGTAEKLSHIEKRLNILEQQVAHMMALLDLLIQDLSDSKAKSRSDSDGKNREE